MADAVHRRVREELGVGISNLRCVLPDFRYRATAADGTVENEVCPVFIARIAERPIPADSEVAEWRWVGWDDYRTLASATPWAISPWSAEQLAQWPDPVERYG